MLRIGEVLTLTVTKRVDFGVYLADDGRDNDKVLLPLKQVPDNVKAGDKIDVFIYRDSKDRPIATVNRPHLTLGEYAPLRVKEVNKIGAFLDWGLEKDLFLPYKEMTKRVKEGDYILVRLYLDKSSRLCASMKGLYHLLDTDSDYQVGDKAKGRIYEFSHNFGTFVAVDDRYSAMIPDYEDTSNLHIGDEVDVRITNIKEDGKLDVTLREKAYIQMDEDTDMILKLLESYAGVLPFTEKASPDVILRETGLSKNAFKRAVGRLYKKRLISIDDGRIRLVK